MERRSRPLAQALIRCHSVTPDDGGSLAVLEAALEPLGFTCHQPALRGSRNRSPSTISMRGSGQAPNFCFAGHTDVVPPGDAKLWRADPFAAEIRDGVLYGRGAADMKTAIAAFAAAVGQYLASMADPQARSAC